MTEAKIRFNEGDVLDLDASAAPVKCAVCGKAEAVFRGDVPTCASCYSGGGHA